jgi:mannose-1-phosphate guanylyltransferase/mannose-6-phosphate isomerase
MDFSQLHTAFQQQDAVFRPWGFYKSLLTTEFSQTKIISLAPGQEISLQKHFHREEYWTVIHGSGIFRLDDERFLVEKGFSVRIPVEAVHWIKNTQTEGALILMEVQMGDYFGEDDIVRLSDKYHRN